MQDELVNKDTVQKQEKKMQDLENDMKSTDELIQTEQLLNLQLSSDYNKLLTDLSHILNQRNSLLLECEGLKTTVSLLQSQCDDLSKDIGITQQTGENLSQQLQAFESSMGEWESESNNILSQYKQGVQVYP